MSDSTIGWWNRMSVYEEGVQVHNMTNQVLYMTSEEKSRTQERCLYMAVGLILTLGLLIAGIFLALESDPISMGAPLLIFGGSFGSLALIIALFSNFLNLRQKEEIKPHSNVLPPINSESK